MSSIYKNNEILDESPSDIDFLKYDDEINRVRNRIKNAIGQKKSMIIAYLGAFGVGKSTVLNKVRGDFLKESTWITFETWRYSNRDELWDAFVIRVIAHLHNKKESTVAKEIDGTKIRPWMVIILISALIQASLVISFILYLQFNGDNGFFEAYLKYAAPVTIPVLLLVGLVGQLNSLAYSNPLKRAFQLEDLLKKSLMNNDKPLAVVIEDIDRSNDDALVFMETLHEFINSNKKNFSQPFIIIAPQSNTAFDALEANRKKYIEHSLKIYDEKMYFNAGIEHATIDSFYQNIDLVQKYVIYKPTMIEITKELAYYHKKGQLTIRMLKHALREVDWFIQAYPDHNPSLALVYALARMLKHETTNTELAVRRLNGRANLASNNGKYIIDRQSVFKACLAIAAGAEGTGEAIGLIDSDGKFMQSDILRQIRINTDRNGQPIIRDEVSADPPFIEVYTRSTYREQLTI